MTENFTKHLYIETYGCQMNVADSEVVAAVMATAGYDMTDDIDRADAVILNTCSIRDNAEQKIVSRLQYLGSLRRKRGGRLFIGVIGCMAERVRDELIKSHGVDIVAGPDAYLDLPSLFGAAEQGQPAINVELSTTETYRDIIPRRLGGAGISGFVSIMRGCNNFCSYCIVPYTRGRERSRPVDSILGEVADLRARGFREVTLLGQNVNSYLYTDEGTGETTGFAELLRRVAASAPDMRVRFTTSHPKDLSDEVIAVIAATPNICRHIHLPVQSGSDAVLRAMNRKYTREWYLGRVAAIRRAMPDCTITTDMFTGFSGETEEDFEQTLSLMREVGFDAAFMFKYSERPGTLASQLDARQCGGGGENRPPQPHDSVAKRDLARLEPPRHRPRVRRAGRGPRQARCGQGGGAHRGQQGLRARRRGSQGRRHRARTRHRRHLSHAHLRAGLTTVTYTFYKYYSGWQASNLRQKSAS